MLYTYGVKGVTDDRVYLYNLLEQEALRIVLELNREFGHKTFKLAHISTRNCPIRDADKKKELV